MATHRPHWPSATVESESYVMTDGQSANLSWCQAPIWGPRPDFYYCQTLAGLLLWVALSEDRTGLSLTTAAGPRQLSHSRIRVPFYFLRFETSPTWRPGPRIYTSQEDGPVLPSGIGFSFRRLLRIVGQRWMYPNPPPQGTCLQLQTATRYLASGRTE
jgi:hypothetical protein